MKINQKGWALKPLIIMSCILFVFLLIACYYIYVLYSNLNIGASSTYVELENDLKIAATKYKEDNSLTSGIVTVSKLKQEGYLLYFNDYNDQKCDGYAMLQDEVDPYIICLNYTTDNYNENNNK